MFFLTAQILQIFLVSFSLGFQDVHVVFKTFLYRATSGVNMDQLETMPFEAAPMAYMESYPHESPPKDVGEVELPAKDAELDADAAAMAADAAAMELLMTKRTLFLGEEEATPDGEEPPNTSPAKHPCPTEIEEIPKQNAPENIPEIAEIPKQNAPEEVPEIFNALENQAI